MANEAPGGDKSEAPQQEQQESEAIKQEQEAKLEEAREAEISPDGATLGDLADLIEQPQLYETTEAAVDMWGKLSNMDMTVPHADVPGSDPVMSNEDARAKLAQLEDSSMSREDKVSQLAEDITNAYKEKGEDPYNTEKKAESLLKAKEIEDYAKLYGKELAGDLAEKQAQMDDKAAKQAEAQEKFKLMMSGPEGFKQVAEEFEEKNGRKPTAEDMKGFFGDVSPSDSRILGERAEQEDRVIDTSQSEQMQDAADKVVEAAPNRGEMTDEDMEDMALDMGVAYVNTKRAEKGEPPVDDITPVIETMTDEEFRDTVEDMVLSMGAAIDGRMRDLSNMTPDNQPVIDTMSDDEYDDYIESMGSTLAQANFDKYMEAKAARGGAGEEGGEGDAGGEAGEPAAPEGAAAEEPAAEAGPEWTEDELAAFEGAAKESALRGKNAAEAEYTIDELAAIEGAAREDALRGQLKEAGADLTEDELAAMEGKAKEDALRASSTREEPMTEDELMAYENAAKEEALRDKVRDTGEDPLTEDELMAAEGAAREEALGGDGEKMGEDDQLEDEMMADDNAAKEAALKKGEGEEGASEEVIDELDMKEARKRHEAEKAGKEGKEGAAEAGVEKPTVPPEAEKGKPGAWDKAKAFAKSTPMMALTIAGQWALAKMGVYGIRALIDVPRYMKQSWDVRGTVMGSRRLGKAVEFMSGGKLKSESMDERMDRIAVSERSAEDIRSKAAAEGRELNAKELSALALLDTSKDVEKLQKNLKQIQGGTDPNSPERKMIDRLMGEARAETNADKRREMLRNLVENQLDTKITGIQAAKQAMNTALWSGAMITGAGTLAGALLMTTRLLNYGVAAGFEKKRSMAQEAAFEGTEPPDVGLMAAATKAATDTFGTLFGRGVSFTERTGAFFKIYEVYNIGGMALDSFDSPIEGLRNVPPGDADPIPKDPIEVGPVPVSPDATVPDWDPPADWAPGNLSEAVEDQIKGRLGDSVDGITASAGAGVADGILTNNVENVTKLYFADPENLAALGLPPDFDIDVVTAEQLKDMDWDKVMGDNFSDGIGFPGDAASLEEAIPGALTIHANNDAIAAFHQANPDVPITAQVADQIIADRGDVAIEAVSTTTDTSTIDAARGATEAGGAGGAMTAFESKKALMLEKISRMRESNEWIQDVSAGDKSVDDIKAALTSGDIDGGQAQTILRNTGNDLLTMDEMADLQPAGAVDEVLAGTRPAAVIGGGAAAGGEAAAGAAAGGEDFVIRAGGLEGASENRSNFREVMKIARDVREGNTSPDDVKDLLASGDISDSQAQRILRITGNDLIPKDELAALEEQGTIAYNQGLDELRQNPPPGSGGRASGDLMDMDDIFGPDEGAAAGVAGGAAGAGAVAEGATPAVPEPVSPVAEPAGGVIGAAPGAAESQADLLAGRADAVTAARDAAAGDAAGAVSAVPEPAAGGFEPTPNIYPDGPRDADQMLNLARDAGSGELDSEQIQVMLDEGDLSQGQADYLNNALGGEEAAAGAVAAGGAAAGDVAAGGPPEGAVLAEAGEGGAGQVTATETPFPDGPRDAAQLGDLERDFAAGTLDDEGVQVMLDEGDLNQAQADFVTGATGDDVAAGAAVAGAAGEAVTPVVPEPAAGVVGAAPGAADSQAALLAGRADAVTAARDAATEPPQVPGENLPPVEPAAPVAAGGAAAAGAPEPFDQTGGFEPPPDDVVAQRQALYGGGDDAGAAAAPAAEPFDQTTGF
ncbi:hypothetical protein ACFL2D_01140, partial [Patescibacteria group bacterium]